MSRYFYDITRKYYLFGRDAVLRELAADPGWTTLVEIGPGTGRNLRRLRRSRPDARLGGIEASDAMLTHARTRCPWARLEQGFAENAPMSEVFGRPPDRILFSYCLSMVEDRAAALANARASVSPAGQVVVVDFADLSELPRIAAERFRAYLRAFHVRPLDDATLAPASSVRYGRGRYYVVARYARTASDG